MSSSQEQKPRKDYSHKVITIPNILSIFRLCLIPVIIYVYFYSRIEQKGLWTAAVLLLSFLTDVADGFIARTFHMISEFGKALDPVADKVTQFAMLACLVFSGWRRLWILLGLIVVKELVSGVTVLMFIRETGGVAGADWHGKLTTGLLYGTMLLHLAWDGIPNWVSWTLICMCAAVMILSFVLYVIKNLRPVIAKQRKEAGKDSPPPDVKE